MKKTKSIRLDDKGRELQKGEDQQPDGRYRYRYKDVNGRQRSEYSWKLVDSDPLPEGAGACKALRVIEREIWDAIAKSQSYYDGEHTTVDDLWKVFVETSTAGQHSKNQYELLYNKHIKPVFGDKVASKLVKSDILKFYNTLVEQNYKKSSIKIIRSLFKRVLNVGLEDDILPYNIVDRVPFVINKDRELYDELEHNQALTKEQQITFVNWIKERGYHYTPFVLFMLETGMRVGEVEALKWSDINFEKRTIKIMKTLHYEKNRNAGKHEISETPTKTKAGRRIIDMTATSYEILKDIHDRIKILKGKNDYVFKSANDTPVINSYIQKMLIGAVDVYNKNHEYQLPHIHPHMFRHTFITRCFEAGIDVKLIAKIVGHTNTNITLDTYTDIQEDTRKDAMKTFETYSLRLDA